MRIFDYMHIYTNACIQSAAAKGHAEAAGELGRRLLRGWGVPKDEKRALKYLVKGSDAGHVRPM
jgi:TPR repeat protein